MRYRYITFGMLLLSAASGADTQRFGAQVHASEWQAKTVKNSCHLTHKIPDYGEAGFSQGKESPLSLLVTTHRHAASSGQSVLRSLPPSWKTGSPIVEIDKVRRMAGKDLFALGENNSIRILAELEKGMTPAFYFKQEKQKNTTVAVTLSPVNFTSAYNKFQSCTRKLPVYNTGKLINSAIYFDSGKIALSLSDKGKLASIVELFKSDRKYKKIKLTAYTDNVGQKAPNLRISKRRMKNVQEFLTGLGVSKKRIKAKAIGEIDKLAMNRTKEMRARNRRVEIKFLKK